MTDKTAQTDFPIHALIKNRWSPRAFAAKKVEPQKLQNLFEAARWAPSSFNEQPWRFIVGQKGEKAYDNIMEALMDGNKAWAHTAPVLLLVASKQRFSLYDKPNAVYQYDAGQAIAYLSMQATAEGLYVHQMGGIFPEKAQQLFQVPEGYEVLTAAAIGYIGQPDSLPENLQGPEKETRTRKPAEEIVFGDAFGKPKQF